MPTDFGDDSVYLNRVKADWSLPLSKGEIVGHGIGVETSSGSPVIRIYAKGMTSERAFRRAHSIPNAIDGLETRIARTSGLEALSSPGRQRTRPILGGLSVAHYDATAGTIGCFVEDEHGAVFILSNNHILANVNRANLGDPILQPGPRDGGVRSDKVGELSHFEDLDFPGPNAMDAAVARVLDDGGIDRKILSLGAVVPPAQAVQVDQRVRKYGRTTGDTTGIVDDVSADLLVSMPVGGDALFTEQISIRSKNGKPFAKPGDSGSLIVDANMNAPVALLFAGDETTTLATPISRILKAFGMTILA